MKLRLEQIYKSGIKILETLDLKKINEVIVFEALELTNAEDGFIVLKTTTGYRTMFSSSKNVSLSSFNNREVIRLLAKKTEISNIKKSDFKSKFPEIISSPILSIITIPLQYSQKNYGVLVLRFKRAIRLTPKDRGFLKLYASMASSSLKKAQYYVEMKKALEIRDTFIAMAAHELRTPLTAIHGYAQLLHKRIDKIEKDDPQRAKWIKHLFEESTRLTALLSDLLSVNRMKTGQVQYLFDQTKLSVIIAEAVEKITKNYKDKDIKFTKNLESTQDVIIGDQQKLLQVFQYLIENGITHSSNGKPILVDLQERSSYYLVSVKDQGEGISPKDLALVLEGFHKKVEGTGFGVKLFLSNNIIKQHNGIMTIESRKNRGTTVYVKLPKVKPGLN